MLTPGYAIAIPFCLASPAITSGTTDGCGAVEDELLKRDVIIIDAARTTASDAVSTRAIIYFFCILDFVMCFKMPSLQISAFKADHNTDNAQCDRNRKNYAGVDYLGSSVYTVVFLYYYTRLIYVIVDVLI